MIFLYILAAYLAMGVVGLFLTYHNPRSPFYGRLDIETVLLGLLVGPGCFLNEVYDMIVPNGSGINSQKVLFQRKSK